MLLQEAYVQIQGVGIKHVGEFGAVRTEGHLWTSKYILQRLGSETLVPFPVLASGGFFKPAVSLFAVLQKKLKNFCKSLLSVNTMKNGFNMGFLILWEWFHIKDGETNNTTKR